MVFFWHIGGNWGKCRTSQNLSPSREVKVSFTHANDKILQLPKIVLETLNTRGYYKIVFRKKEEEHLQKWAIQICIGKIDWHRYVFIRMILFFFFIFCIMITITGCGSRTLWCVRLYKLLRSCYTSTNELNKQKFYQF